jgi:predicted acylesterase/phospholipase RssA
VGLTLIRKSDGVAPKKTPRVALVLAGGAVSGGAFKVGGLKALNDFLVERKITDMDLYVGLSAGAILGSSLAAGVTPDEMIKVAPASTSCARSISTIRTSPSSPHARRSSSTTCSRICRASPAISPGRFPGCPTPSA